MGMGALKGGYGVIHYAKKIDFEHMDWCDEHIVCAVEDTR